MFRGDCTKFESLSGEAGAAKMDAYLAEVGRAGETHNQGGGMDPSVCGTTEREFLPDLDYEHSATLLRSHITEYRVHSRTIRLLHLVAGQAPPEPRAPAYASVNWNTRS